MSVKQANLEQLQRSYYFMTAVERKLQAQGSEAGGEEVWGGNYIGKYISRERKALLISYYGG